MERTISHPVVSTVKPMARLNNIVLIVAMNVMIYVLAEEIQLYSDKYDYIDHVAALNNDTIRDSYYNCFMELVPCQAPQKTLTGIFGEAYMTNCKRCTEKQKEMFKQVEEWYKMNRPDQWENLVAKSVDIMKKKKADQ